jgi:phosphoribosylamine--glycine ligase
MRVLIIDTDRCGLDFAHLCAEAGHEVKWYRWAKHPIKDGKGFRGIQVVDNWRTHMRWAKEGLILTTANNKFMKELDAFRDFGFPIFAPTAASAAMEVKRADGMKLMQEAGIDVPPYQQFKSLEDASKFAWKTDRAWVFKTLGDEEDKSLSYVASDPADLAGWIDRKIASGMKLKGPCMLQEKVDMIAEVGLAGWMGRDGFLPGKWEVSFEHKKLMPGDKGPNTGEQGTVCQYAEKSKIADDVLLPLEKAFMKMGHRGDLNVNGAIDAKGRYWPFEWTMRLGWPDFYIRCAMHKGDPAQWMADALKGKDTLKVSKDAFIGVVLAQPQYPYDTAPPEKVEGNPISGAEQVWDQVHPVQMMVGKGPVLDGEGLCWGPQLQTTGEYVMVVTGHGKTVSAAQKDVYGAEDQIKFPDKMVRTDIGKKLEKQLPELHKLGFATDLEF